jgi:predicted GNAT family acetyltransferase
VIDVRRNDERNRYEIVVDEQLVGIAEYDVDGDTMVFPHTVINGNMRGQGFGDQLVQAALDDVRARGQRVRPLCWFVDQFIREHEEYADLVA